MNRIEPNISDIKSEKDLGERMELIMYALNDTVTPIPEEGTICTFKYFAKTPKLQYDQHPLVAVSDIVQQEELDDLMSLNYKKMVLNK